MASPRICARFDDLTPGGSAFELRNPMAELVAHDLDDVSGVIERAERAAQSGSWVAGYVAYEAAPAFDAALRVRGGGRNLPPAWFGVFATRSEVPPIPGPLTRTRPHWDFSWSPERHAEAMARIKELLEMGETYQVNLTVRARALVGDPITLYAGMAQAQGGAYNAYLETGQHAIVCASPELFFERAGHHLVTRPMKGTRPRGRWPEEDTAQAEALIASAKDRAEHVMIVDLLRNDLGRIAQPGTVSVEDLAAVERYHTVWQLTSTIGAQLPNSVGLVGVFAALFPSGSVTGAPKPRTMQIIADLESDRRGIYCGAVGYLTPGTPPPARFAVGIRTATVELATGSGEYGAGGGITWSSEPEAEWAELGDKCAILDSPSRPPALLETLRFDPTEGPGNLERHLSRLAASANFFAIPFDSDQTKTEVQSACMAATEPRRVRVVLSAGGAVSVSLSDLPQPRLGPVRLALATQGVHSRDRRLFHKSTDRSRYSDLRAARPDVDDVIIYNERGEVTETTIANLAVRLGGRWWTPPLDCGVLPGVERERLLEVGELAELVLTVADLGAAEELAVVSSLRGWQPAVFIEDGTGATGPWPRE
ncbi:MAG: chorismate-binding protein [Acidimicrobiales bacterium]